jgi:RNA polymerase sigma factor (sigma-70 family)
MPKTYTDEEYLNGLIERDSIITAALYQELYQKAFSTLSLMGARSEDIEDIVQNSIVALYSNIRKGTYKLSDESKLSTYLVQICKYQWFNIVRKKDHDNLSIEDEFLINHDDFDIEKDIETVERNKLIAEAIEQLGEKCKDLLRLYYWEDLSMEEIGEKLKMKPNSAKNGKYRCMQSLRDILLKLKRNQIV